MSVGPYPTLALGENTLRLAGRPFDLVVLRAVRHRVDPGVDS